MKIFDVLQFIVNITFSFWRYLYETVVATDLLIIDSNHFMVLVGNTPCD